MATTASPPSALMGLILARFGLPADPIRTVGPNWGGSCDTQAEQNSGPTFGPEDRRCETALCGSDLGPITAATRRCWSRRERNLYDASAELANAAAVFCQVLEEMVGDEGFEPSTR